MIAIGVSGANEVKRAMAGGKNLVSKKSHRQKQKNHKETDNQNSDKELHGSILLFDFLPYYLVTFSSLFSSPLFPSSQS
jgi:hypothetical protein